jgi:hypothetical protein
MHFSDIQNAAREKKTDAPQRIAILPITSRSAFIVTSGREVTFR